jgi:hypothetical protein
VEGRRVAWNGGVRFIILEDMTMKKPILPMITSAKLLVFSYLKYLAHDPTSSPGLLRIPFLPD